VVVEEEERRNGKVWRGTVGGRKSGL